jgi:hypothetical protein
MGRSDDTAVTRAAAKGFPVPPPPTTGYGAPDGRAAFTARGVFNTRSVEFRDALPLIATGTVLKDELRQGRYAARRRTEVLVTTNHVAPTAQMSLAQIERLDDVIIALLARRRAMTRELPPPARARAVDPDFAEAVREMTDRYRQELGGAGELVARAVMVLCHHDRRP